MGWMVRVSGGLYSTPKFFLKRANSKTPKTPRKSSFAEEGRAIVQRGKPSRKPANNPNVVKSLGKLSQQGSTTYDLTSASKSVSCRLQCDHAPKQ